MSRSTILTATVETKAMATDGEDAMEKERRSTEATTAAVTAPAIVKEATTVTEPVASASLRRVTAAINVAAALSRWW